MGKCQRGVIWKDSVAKHSFNGLDTVLKLQDSLLDDTYKIEEYYEFTVHEPKTRQIVSTKFKDRVFQRSLTDNYLYDVMTKSFIYDNHACQLGRGTDKARERLNCHLQRFFRQHGVNGYVLNCDMKNYFGSTPHEVAKAAVRKSVKDPWAYEQVAAIIDSYDKDGTGIGLGLGSQITQLIQLAVLDDLDRLIKEELKIKHYIRYMDDLILIHPCKEYLKKCHRVIGEEVQRLGLSLNKKKTQLFPLSQGLNFLGFKYSLSDTGAVIRVLGKDNIKKRKRKLRKYKKLVTEGKMTKEKSDQCFESWKAHAEKSNPKDVINQMDRYYKELWR